MSTSVGFEKHLPRNKRVLVVEDNSDSIAILSALLEGYGMAVAAAQDGSEALARLAEEVPDLVLLDVRMPGLDGFEVLQRIRANPATSRVPVILVTARLEDRDVMNGYQYGADYYITKPCTAKQLFYGIALVLS